MMTNVLTAATVLALCVACQSGGNAKAEATGSRFAVDFHVVTDDGEPAAAAAITKGDLLLGRTGTDGHLKTALSGVDGQNVPISLVCPVGHIGPTNPTSLRLTYMRRVTTTEAQTMDFTFTCRRSVRDIVILVRTDGGAQLPVRVEGKPAGSTNADGIAHILLHTARTIRAFNVSLDTTMRGDLKPRNPSRTYELTGNDAILVFDQAFVSALKPVVHRSNRPPRKHIPYRVD